MEHERGAFKVNREFAPGSRRKQLQRLNQEPDRRSRLLDTVPKICAGGSEGCHICLWIHRFASKAYIFFAQVIGNRAFPLVEYAELINENISL
jgi:hypothetical protein